MITKTYKVVDSKGVGLRVFRDRISAYEFIKIRPELQIVVVEHNSYEEALNTVGECLL